MASKNKSQVYKKRAQAGGSDQRDGYGKSMQSVAQTSKRAKKRGALKSPAKSTGKAPASKVTKLIGKKVVKKRTITRPLAKNPVSLKNAMSTKNPTR